MTYPLSFTKTATITCTLALTLLQPVAWGQSPAHPASAGSSSMPNSGIEKQGMGKPGMDMQAMMKNNSDEMASMKMTGNADVDFAKMMRIHHQGAIKMAEAELREGKNAQMRKMAKDIIAAQKNEIAQLEKFLANNGQPAGAMGK